MRFLSKAKDGGPDSPVDAYFLVEIKGLFSIALLKFNRGGREAYHTHAFNALTWFLSGFMIEENLVGDTTVYHRGFYPKVTLRKRMHRVVACEDSWCFTIRGPWSKTWEEYSPKLKRFTRFKHGRVVVDELDWSEQDVT